MVSMTPERLETLRAAARAGMSSRDIETRYRISDHTLRKYGVMADIHREVTDRRMKRGGTDDEIATIRRMCEAGASMASLKREMNMGRDRLRDILEKNGIHLMSREERDACSLGKPSHRKTAAHNGTLVRRSGHQGLEWVPPRDETDLQAAVTRLRRKYPVVCAERTLARPYVIPEPYTSDTLFRVGRLENVTAAKLLEMARHA